VIASTRGLTAASLTAVAALLVLLSVATDRLGRAVLRRAERVAGWR
jgi:hypothetical protein